MATYTRNNETISGSSGSMDYHTLTSAADSLTVTNVTVESGGSVPVPDYWEPYTVNGGVMIYDAKDGNDTTTGRNLKIEGGLFQFIGGDQNDKLSINSANVSDGSLKVNGGWDDDSLNVSNVTVSGGNAYVHGDTGTDTVSVSKVSVTGGNFIQRDHGRSNINTASEVTIQGGRFEVSTGILERVGDDPFDANSVVESIGGSNTLSANKISMTGGSLAVYSEGANNSIKVTDVTMTGGNASIYGGKTANINGEQGNDTISVSNFYVTRPSGYYSEGGEVSILGGGSNNSVSVSNVSVSGYTYNTYTKEGFYISGGVSNNTVSVSNLTLDSAARFYVEDGTSGGGKTSLKDITFSGDSTTSLKAKGDTVSLDGVNFEKSGYISISGNGNISAQNITNTVGGGISMTGGENSADEISLEDVTISSGNISMNGNGGADNFTVDNVSMTGGNIYVIGGNGNANVSVSNIDKTAGYFDIDMGGSDSVTSGNDTIFVENISNAQRAYFDIYARDGADSISIKNSSSVSGYLRAWGGAGKDTITAENISMTSSGYFSIVGGADEDLISVKSSNNVWAYGDEGNDTISLEDFSGGFYAGAGNDSVSVTKMIEGNRGHFYGGEGNDTIEFYDTWMPYYNSYSGGGDVTGDEGDDLITARNATIYGTGFFGGDGNDTISVDNSTVTSGFRFYNGAGNDSISVSNITGNFSGDVMFYSEYSTYASDGNDTISLDNWTLTGDDSQRFLINGNFFTTDNSSINGADSISIKNIIAPNATFYVYGKGGNDTVSFENMTLGGLGISYGDTMVRNGNIYGNFDSGNDSISVSNIEFYKGSSSNVSLNGGEGADTISVDGVTLGDENDGRYTQSHLTVTGGAGADVINVSNVTVTGSYSKGYILGEDGADKISVTDSSGLQITGGDGNDTIYFGGAVDATLTDLAAGDVVSLSGDYKKAYYKDGVLIYGTGVKVSLSGVDDVADISNITIYNGSTRTNFGSFVTVLEWKLEDGVASYGDLLTVSGLSANATFEDITVGGKAINTMDDEEIKASGLPVVISKNALDTEKVIEITNGFTLALASDVTDTPKSTPEHWKISEGAAAYFATGLTAGYVLSNNTIFYQSEVKGDVVTEIDGLSAEATLEDISMSGKVVTVKNNALDAANTVTISNGYHLALADEVIQPVVVAPNWQVGDGAANYMVGGTTAGFVVDEDTNTIYQQKADAGESQIEITGLSENATVDDISMNKKIITLSANALGSEVVQISDGYTLALGKDVETSVITPEGWQIASGKGTYKTESNTAGYTLTDNQIVYVRANPSDTIVEVGGLKTSATAKNLLLDSSNNLVSIAAAAVQGEVTVSGGYGISMGSGSYSKTTVKGSDGDDTIYNAGNKLAINTGAGKDFISLKSGTSGNTINGGAGDDYISTTKGKNIYQYATGDGNDIIEGFSENDTLQITSGEFDSWKVDDLTDGIASGGDLTFYVGDGSITITDIADKKIYTAIGNGKAVANYYTTTGIYNDKKTAVTLRADLEDTFTADNSIISIDGSAVENDIQISGNSKANSILGGVAADTISGGSGNDTIFGGSGNDSIVGDAGNDKIYGDAGDDTLSGGTGNDTLTGGNGADVFVYQGGNDVIADYTEEDKISIASGEISSISATTTDVAIKVGSGKITIKDGVGKKITINDETNIYEKGKVYDENKTSVTVTASASLESNLISINAASSSALKYSANDSANSILGGKGGDSILGGGGNDTIFGNAGTDKIWGDNGNDYLDGGAGNDTIFGGEGNDTLIGGDGNDTLNGGAGSNTLTGGDGKDLFIYEGGNDVITDYTAGQDKIKISEEIISSSINNSDVILKTASGNVTVQNGKGNKLTILDANNKSKVYIYETGVNYNDKKTAATLTSDFTGSYTADTALISIDGTEAGAVQITGNDKANKIWGGTSNNTLYGGSGNDTIYGSAGADSIFGDAGNDKLYGDAGADTLSGGLGNDTLTGGDGADVFVYQGGNDVIADYTEGDKISIASGEISSVGVSSNDVALKIGSNTLKIKDGVGKKLTINDEVYIYEKGKIYDANKTSVTVTASITETLESSIVTVDGSDSSGALKVLVNDSANSIIGGKGGDSILGGGGNDTIYGNAGADKLFGDNGNDLIDGGAGNDSLYGGAGNDTLTGGDGNDVFIFESGNDTITDYTAGKDKIKFTEEFTTDPTVSGGNVIFETASGKITVQNSAGVEITYIDNNGKTNKQTYFDLNARTLDLMYDDNFVTDEFGIDEISEQKFEVQNIETQNNLELSQPVITYGEDK